MIRTPVIDSLAQRGTRFAQAYVTTPICAASRASILTGVVERTHGYTFEAPPLAARWREQSYPARLRAAGWRTAQIGKFDEGVPAELRSTVWDYTFEIAPNPFFKPQPDGTLIHETDLAAQTAIEWLGTLPATQPFCLDLRFNAPHAQYSDISNLYPWPPSADGLYEGVTIPPPRLSDPSVFDALPEFLRQSFGRETFHWCCDDPDKYQRTMRGHYRMISGVDNAIGRVLDELRRLGREQDTVVIFLSDNGDYLGERGLDGKWSHFEEAMRIPFIVVDPRAAAAARGRVSLSPVLTIDLAPTLLELAGLSPLGTKQGISQLSTLHGGEAPSREDFLCEELWLHATIPRWEGVHGGRFVYARYIDEQPAYEFLHDLRADPDELRNVAGDPAYAAALAEQRARCDALIASAVTERG